MSLFVASIKVKCESGGGATPVGRCHPCSRFELVSSAWLFFFSSFYKLLCWFVCVCVHVCVCFQAHQTTECIVTGYKQRVRCEGEKKEKYASLVYPQPCYIKKKFFSF